MVESGPKPVDAPPGTVVAGRFRILAELGRGGMAHVHRALDLVSGREVALKLLKPEIAQNAEAMERFRREAEFLSGLRHPAIVGVEAFGQLDDGRLYLAMEILRGETLGTCIRRGKLSPEMLSPILAGAAVGLDAAHRAGVIHRDLKPDNVFLVAQQGTDAVQVKLLDFGISKIDGRQSLTQTGQILGTPRYMAPEQLAGDRDIDGRADVYALGVILYEALAGQPAFPSSHPADLIVAIIHGRATPLRAVRPDVSAELEAVVGRAMARARDARYASATDLAQAWFEVVHGEPTFAGVRTGAGTRMMGAHVMDTSASDSQDGRGGDVPFRPATFREFEVQEPKAQGKATVQLSEYSPAELAKSVALPAPSASAPLTAAPAPQPAPALGGFERTPARAGAQMMPAMPMAGVQQGPVAVPQPSAQPTTAPSSHKDVTPRGVVAPRDATPLDEPSLELPTRRIPWVPIMGVLVCLALCTVLGVGVTALYRAQRADVAVAAEGPRPEPIAAAPALVPTPVVPVPTLAVDASATTEQALVPAAPVDASTPDASRVAQRPALDAGRPVTPTTPRTTPPTTTNTAPTMTHDTTATPPPWSGDETGEQASASELATRAKEAFRAGNARECVSLATEALAVGADATTYALRGDCYRMLGDNARALRSYQRFCQLAPSHPRTASIRATAESLGGTCP